MPLAYGTVTAPEGMTTAIYNELILLFEADLINSGAERAKVEEGFKKLSYAIAAGVIKHVKLNMDISGIHVAGGTQTSDITGHVS